MTRPTGTPSQAYTPPDLLVEADLRLHPETKIMVTPYIVDRMRDLAIYDGTRPQGHVYEFHHHAERVAGLLRDFALYMGWTQGHAETLYWACLPHDIGKTALPVSIWDSAEKPTKEEKALRRTHVAEGLNIVRNHFDDAMLATPFLRILLDIMENHHESLDGTGLFRKTAGDLSLIARMACICDSFDGWRVFRPHFGDRDISADGVITRMETEKEGQFDKDLLRLFRAMMAQRTDD